MIPPLLKLIFVKGLRDGESLEFKPGSTIRVGRIVSGNEIAIKDKGISTKHLQIESYSEKWIIYDRGSSNGTELNSDTLYPDSPYMLSHGDTIKLGQDTSIVVSFVTDVQAQEEHKLPPRPRKYNRRLAVSDSDPVQEKPTRKGSRCSKQDQHEVLKRARAARSKTLEDISDEEKEPEVNFRVAGVKKGNTLVHRGEITESVQDSIKLETEDARKGLETAVMKRATRRKQIENAGFGMENVEIEDTALEEKDDKRPSRATRSKKNEIGGDCFLELEMVLKQARKKKKMEQKPSKRSDDREDERESCDGSKRKEQVEIKNILVDDDDGETENLQDKIDEERDEEKVEKISNLEKMTLREFFDLMEVQLLRQITEETEKLIEPMKTKALSVQMYIEEQNQAKGSSFCC